MTYESKWTRGRIAFVVALLVAAALFFAAMYLVALGGESFVRSGGDSMGRVELIRPEIRLA